jgi:hypothetical protein
MAPPAGLGINQHGSKLIVLTGENRAQPTVVQNPETIREFITHYHNERNH